MSFFTGETVGIILFIIGLYGLAARRNILKAILSLGIIQSGIILFFLSSEEKSGIKPPIGEESLLMVDPLPQALMITAIVIGVAVTAVALTMFMTMYHRFGTTNWVKVMHKRGES